MNCREERTNSIVSSRLMMRKEMSKHVIQKGRSSQGIEMDSVLRKRTFEVLMTKTKA